MFQDKLEQAVVDGITRFFKSEEGEALVGNIVMKALSLKLDREIEVETFDKDLGRTVVKKERHNMVEYITLRQGAIEGAIRGCQKDSAEARNRSTQARDTSRMVVEMTRMLGEAVQIAFDQHNPIQARDVLIEANEQILRKTGNTDTPNRIAEQ